MYEFAIATHFFLKQFCSDVGVSSGKMFGEGETVEKRRRGGRSVVGRERNDMEKRKKGVREKTKEGAPWRRTFHNSTESSMSRSDLGRLAEPGRVPTTVIQSRTNRSHVLLAKPTLYYFFFSSPRNSWTTMEGNIFLSSYRRQEGMKAYWKFAWEKNQIDAMNYWENSLIQIYRWHDRARINKSLFLGIYEKTKEKQLVNILKIQ